MLALQVVVLLIVPQCLPHPWSVHAPFCKHSQWSRTKQHNDSHDFGALNSDIKTPYICSGVQVIVLVMAMTKSSAIVCGLWRTVWRHRENWLDWIHHVITSFFCRYKACNHEPVIASQRPGGNSRFLHQLVNIEALLISSPWLDTYVEKIRVQSWRIKLLNSIRHFLWIFFP